MNETQVLFSLGNLTLTAYGLCVGAGALLAVVLTVWLGRKKPGTMPSMDLCLVVLPMALLGARLTYCLTMLESILVDYGAADFFNMAVWQGGYTLYGAVLGGLAGAWLYAKFTRRPVGAMMDLAAPGAALAILAERLGEYFTDQGLGDYVLEEASQRFPLAVQNEYGDWQSPVFLYEALAALVVLAVLLLVRFRQSGGRAECFIILLGLSQILLESWREDEFIRFGFVRFTQIAAIVTVAAVLGARLVRCVRAGGWSAWQIARTVLFALGIGVCIGVEFALDKSTIDNGLLYGVMTGTLAVMGATVLVNGKIRGNACTMPQEMVK